MRRCGRGASRSEVVGDIDDIGMLVIISRHGFLAGVQLLSGLVSYGQVGVSCMKSLAASNQQRDRSVRLSIGGDRLCSICKGWVGRCGGDVGIHASAECAYSPQCRGRCQERLRD